MGVEEKKSNRMDTSDISEKEVDANAAVPLEGCGHFASLRPRSWNFSFSGRGEAGVPKRSIFPIPEVYSNRPQPSPSTTSVGSKSSKYSHAVGR